MSDLTVLPPAVRRFLRSYVLRRRRLAAVRGIGQAGCTALVVLLAAMLLDRFVHFPSIVRLVLLGLTGVTVLVLLLRPLLRLARPQVDWLAAAARVEEQSPRFGQRLLTVASRLLGRGEFRGSDEMLDQLSFELNREAADARPAQLLPVRVAVRPWLLLLVLAGATVALAQVPELNLPRLGLRFLTPWRDINPVTTTQLAVSPGDADVQQGGSVRIEARVERLGSGTVFIHLAEGDDEEWQRVPMTPADDLAESSDDARPTSPASRPLAANGRQVMRFTYTIGSVDRDVRYYVAAGDASSPPRQLRVLRKPAVAEYRIRYVYPPFANRPESTVSSTDGRIEAPIGTEAHITIVATEPLEAALLTFGAEKQLMTRPPGDQGNRTRVGRIVVSRDGRYDVDLITTRQQTGSSSSAGGACEIRAIADRPPAARIAGANAIWRSGRHQVLPLEYEAVDDFGVESLVLRAQVLGSPGPPIEFPVWSREAGDANLPADPREDRRRHEGRLDFDLANLAIAPGDVVTLTLAVKDSGNAVIPSDPLQVLATAQPHSLEGYERATELEAAAQLAESAAADYDTAARALAGAERATSAEDVRTKEPVSAQIGRVSRQLKLASGTSAVVRRVLVRALARNPSVELEAAILAWVDTAQHNASTASALLNDLNSATNPDWSRWRKAGDEQLEIARRLRDELWTVAQGERAWTILADLDHLAASQRRAPGPNADKAVADRFRAVQQRVRADVTAAVKGLGIKEKPAEATARLKEIIARENGLVRSRSKPDLAKSVREWAEPARSASWDTQTMSDRLQAAALAEAARPLGDPRVARDLNLAGRAVAAIEGGEDAAVGQALVQAFEAVKREHATYRDSVSASKVDDLSARRTAANDARRQLAAWAGEHGHDAPGVTTRPPATGPTTHPAVPALLRLARSEAIALQGSADAADGRHAAAAAVDAQHWAQASQHADPAVAAAALQALQRGRRAAEATRLMDDAIAEQEKLAAQTADAATGKAGLTARQRAVATRISEIAARYSPVGSTGLPGTVTDGNVRTRVASMRANVFDSIGLPRLLLQGLNRPLDLAQAELSRIQEELADLDPLAAAISLAGSSADLLARHTPDLRSVATLQAQTIAALDVARRRAIRYAMIQRLTAVRTLRLGTVQPAIADVPVASPGGPAAGTGRVNPLSGFGAMLQDWRRLRPREQDDPAALLLEQDVPGYGPAIKAYFEALGKKPAASPGG